jgi:hypothetical protein
MQQLMNGAAMRMLDVLGQKLTRLESRMDEMHLPESYPSLNNLSITAQPIQQMLHNTACNEVLRVSCNYGANSLLALPKSPPSTN